MRRKRRQRTCVRWSADEDKLLSKLVRDGYSTRSIEQALRPIHPLRLSGKDPKAKRTWEAIRCRISLRFRLESEESRQGVASIRAVACAAGVSQRLVARVVAASKIATHSPLQSIEAHRRGGPKVVVRLVDKEETLDAVRAHLERTSDGRSGPRSYAHRHMLNVSVRGETCASANAKSILVARALAYAAAASGVPAESAHRRSPVWRLTDAQWGELVPLALKYLKMRRGMRCAVCKRAMAQAREAFALREASR